MRMGRLLHHSLLHHRGQTRLLAAKGADAAQMSRWSKRNVFPSKIGLGFMFAALGVLVLLA